MRAYIDSDILIWHLRGDRRAERFLRSLGSESDIELWIGALQRAEVVFFMRPAEEPATLAFLSHFKTEPVTQQVVDEASALYRKWHSSHGVDINDAMLAATVKNTGGKIYTLNVKHYPMSDLVVLKAWK
jgi:predicted nucleic acid-binding protein